MQKIIFLIMLCLFIAGCGDGEKDNSSPNEANEVRLDEKNEKKTKEQTKDDFQLKEIGESFNLKDWEVTLESFEFNQSVRDEYASSSVDEGNKFLILNFKITNNGAEADTLIRNGGNLSIKAIYNEEYEYRDSITLIDGDLHHENIRPLSSVDGFVVIEVPDVVAEASESIILVLESEKDKVQINIR